MKHHWLSTRTLFSFKQIRATIQIILIDLESYHDKWHTQCPQATVFSWIVQHTFLWTSTWGFHNHTTNSNSLSTLQSPSPIWAFNIHLSLLQQNHCHSFLLPCFNQWMIKVHSFSVTCCFHKTITNSSLNIKVLIDSACLCKGVCQSGSIYITERRITKWCRSVGLEACKL